jgi:tRNA A-37 threonylcarbamoyl transferase component Bud32/tetratricopeptide (TPR) repeat protein
MNDTRISHYRLGKLLGRGGMGEVYEAEDLDLGRRVALKFIAPELAADPENLKRFEREARSAAALNHPNIATLYAFERDGERRFIAMELVPGESLRSYIRRGPIPIADAIAIARDVAGGLATAHRRGIVHRDIKPENLMFDEDGRVKVMDFGLARAALASQLTMTGTTMGTAGYMAPESLRGAAGPAADVFALGVILHEMLAGEMPFKGDNPLALMYTITNEPPKPLKPARPDVPEALEQLAARLLEKDPEKRPDAATAARELAVMAGTAPPAGAEFASADALEQQRIRTEELETVPIRTGERAVPGEAIVPLEHRVQRAKWLIPFGQGRRGLWLFPVLLILAVIAAGAALFVFGRGAGDHRNSTAALHYNNLGHQALLADSAARAEQWFALALKSDPYFVPALVNLGQLYRGKGSLDSAAILFDTAAKHAGSDTGSLALAEYGLGQIDLQSGALDGAATHLTHALALDSMRVEYYNDLGWALANSGHAGQARQVLELGLVRFPDQEQLRKNLALAMSKQGQFAPAIEVLDRLTVTNPNYPSAWGLRAVLRMRLGDVKGSSRDWKAYTAFAPDSAERAGYEKDLGGTVR